jgi:hypothetical protein
VASTRSFITWSTQPEPEGLASRRAHNAARVRKHRRKKAGRDPQGDVTAMRNASAIALPGSATPGRVGTAATTEQQATWEKHDRARSKRTVSALRRVEAAIPRRSLRPRRNNKDSPTAPGAHHRVSNLRGAHANVNRASISNRCLSVDILRVHQVDVGRSGQMVQLVLVVIDEQKSKPGPP